MTLAQTGHMPIYSLLFGIAAGGIAFVLISRNRRAKRIVLPIANAAFHSIILFGVFTGDATLRVSRPLLVVIVLANAVLTQSTVLYCGHCGGTYLAYRGTRCRTCGEQV